MKVIGVVPEYLPNFVFLHELIKIDPVAVKQIKQIVILNLKFIVTKLLSVLFMF